MQTMFTLGIAMDNRATRFSMGDMVSRGDRDATLAKIAAGTRKLAEVRNWIAAKMPTDPMLRNTFKQAHIVENFWGYMDLVDKDQYYVDQTKEILENSDPTTWDVQSGHLARTDDWARAIDIMYSAMLEYGAAPKPAAGPIVPGVPRGAITTPPPAAPAADMTPLIIGAGALAAVGIVALLAR